MGKRIPWFRVACDPGNKKGGLAFRNREGVVMSWTYWDCVIPFLFFDHLEHQGENGHPPNILFVCEVPQNGTHASRGGVHWAAGEICGRLRALYRVKSVKVKPRDWRKIIYGADLRHDTKRKAMAEERKRFKYAFPAPSSDDEAEARLILLAAEEAKWK